MTAFRYLPITDEDRLAMLKTIGVASDEALFSDVPENIRYNGELNVEAPLSEPELMRFFTELAEKNATTSKYTSFLGAGVYDHYIPSVVDSVISRAEFYTAYTPYQAEVSQGELQAIFEFQSMICELTGMDVANSSMYDGSTALAEAALLSSGVTKKKKIVVSGAVHPEYIQVLRTYAHGRKLDVATAPSKEGTANLTWLREQVDEETACVIVQYPNFFGCIEPLKEIEPIVHRYPKTHLIVCSNPLALGILTPPGVFRADIVVGDAQPLGIPESFGGPHCGYFAVNKKLMRKVPGRLVGETVDEDGRKGYVLTLQAREQHIRRDKATSNICSNQALNALASSVAMTAFGRIGIRNLAAQNVRKAHYAADRCARSGIRVVTAGSWFNEFVIDCGRPVAEVNEALLRKGIIGGYDLEKVSPDFANQMLVAVTEMRTRAEIDRFVETVKGVSG